MIRKIFAALALAVMATGYISNATAAPDTAAIIDGTRAPAVDFPAVALMSFPDTVCTGTLVGSRYVLSAAHCFFTEKNKLRTDIDQMGAVVANVRYAAKKVTVHPSYVSRSSACIDGETDAAVMELVSDVPGVTPIPLLRSAPTVGTDLLLAGFGVQGTGSNGEDDTFPADGFLNFGYTKIETVDSSYVNWVMNPGEANTAGGDSGGPAFMDIGGVRTLNSITCGGTGNAGFNTSSSNTRVDLIAAWVDSLAGTTPPSTAPSFVGLGSVTTGVGKSFSYVIQASGTSPVAVSATSDLPPGLTLSGNTISGTPTTAGNYSVDLAASNAFGNTTGTLNIVVAAFDPDVALTLKKAKVNFDDEDADLLSFSGSVVVGKKFKPRNVRVRIQVGELVDTFKLNSLGYAQRKNGYDLVELTGRMSNGAFTGTKVNFYIGLGDKQSLFDKLDTLFPIDTDDLGADFRVNLPIEIEIKNIVYRGTIAMKHTSGGKWVNG